MYLKAYLHLRLRTNLETQTFQRRKCNATNKQIKDDSATGIFEKKILHDLLISLYLQPLSSLQNKRKETKLDHNNEKILAQNLVKDAELAQHF